MKKFNYAGSNYQILKNPDYTFICLMQLAKEIKQCEDMVDFLRIHNSGYDNDIYITCISHIHRAEDAIYKILQNSASEV